MSIQKFFTKEIVIRRFSSVGGHKKAYQATATVEGHIQEMSREARRRLGIIEERTWIAWFDIDEDIQEGDRLTDPYGTDYQVKEVTKKDYGVNQHLEVILEEPNE